MTEFMTGLSYTLIAGANIFYLLYLVNSFTESRRGSYVWTYKHGRIALWLGLFVIAFNALTIYRLLSQGAT